MYFKSSSEFFVFFQDYVGLDYPDVIEQLPSMLLTDCRDDRVTLNKNDAMTREQLNALMGERNISVDSIPIFEHIFTPTDLNGLKLASKSTTVQLRPRDNHAVARCARTINNECNKFAATFFQNTPSLPLWYKVSGSNVDSWGLLRFFHQ
jgi:hypothetical protein